MFNVSRDPLSRSDASSLTAAPRAKDYGAIENAPSSQGSQEGHLDGVPVREAYSSAVSTFFEILGNPVKTAVSAGNAIQSAIKIVTEHRLNHTSQASQLKAKRTLSEKNKFAESCVAAHLEKIASSGEVSLSSGEQEQLDQIVRTDYDKILDAVANEAAKYITETEKTASLAKASHLFSSQDTFNLALSQALGDYRNSFVAFDTSFLKQHHATSRITDEAVSKAINLAATLMSRHWSKILTDAS